MTQPNDISLDKILATKVFQNFVEAVRHFCLLIETKQSDNPKEFLETIKKHLSVLYALGLDLPGIYLSSGLDLSHDLSDTEKKTIRQFISDRVPFSYYWIVLNPVDMQNDADVGAANLLDDLEETYCDIKCGLIMLDRDNFSAKENAVWKLKFDYAIIGISIVLKHFRLFMVTLLTPDKMVIPCQPLKGWQGIRPFTYCMKN